MSKSESDSINILPANKLADKARVKPLIFEASVAEMIVAVGSLGGTIFEVSPTKSQQRLR